MSFNPFDIAEQQYRKQNDLNESSSNENSFLSSTGVFDVAENLYKNQNEPQDNSWWDDTVRATTRTGSRIVETILGLPGDIASGFTELAKQPAGFGLAGIGLKQLIGEGNYNRSIGGLATTPPVRLPGQRDLQDFSQGLTRGYTAPQSGIEETGDEVIKTLTNLLIPVGGSSNIVRGNASRLSPVAQQLMRFGRNLGSAVLGESAKEGVKLYGGSENAQELSKMGTLFLTGLTLPRLTGEANPENYLSSIYKSRDNLIPQGTLVPSTTVEQNLNNFVQQRLKRGGTTPEKSQVLGVVNDFVDQIQSRGGHMEMQELIEMQRSINRNRANVMMAPLDKPGVRNARRLYGEASNIINDSIEGYLATINPESLQLHRQANAAWGTLMQSNKASEFILNKAKSIPLKTGLATLFGGGVFYNPTLAAKGIAVAGIGAGITQTYKTLNRFLNDPTLRHYYNELIKNSLTENSIETTKYLKKLDEEYDKKIKNPNSFVNKNLRPGEN